MKKMPSHRPESTVRVYFSAARHNRAALPIRRLIRCSRKQWLIQYDHLLCLLIRKLGRSPMAHICVGIDGGVIDPQINGNVWWAELEFVKTYPSLLRYVSVPAPKQPDAGWIQDRGRRPALPTLIRWLTRGRTTADDCLTVALRLLRSAGIDVDPRTHTVQKLYDQLIQLPGARVVPIQDPQPVPRPRRDEPGAGEAAH